MVPKSMMTPRTLRRRVALMVARMGKKPWTRLILMKMAPATNQRVMFGIAAKTWGCTAATAEGTFTPF
jgi:hypothetical protein